MEKIVKACGQQNNSAAVLVFVDMHIKHRFYSCQFQLPGNSKQEHLQLTVIKRECPLNDSSLLSIMLCKYHQVIWLGISPGNDMMTL